MERTRLRATGNSRNVYLIAAGTVLVFVGLLFWNFSTTPEAPVASQDSATGTVSDGAQEAANVDLRGFAIRNGIVYYYPEYGDPVRIESLDPSSFVAVDNRFQGTNGFTYAKDADDVYVGDRLGTVLEIPNADPRTFRPLDANFAQDATTVFCLVEMGGGEAFEPRILFLAGADPASFQVLGSGYAKDSHRVYFSPWNEREVQVVEGADPQTFIVTNTQSTSDADGYLAQDAQHTYDFGRIQE